MLGGMGEEQVYQVTQMAEAQEEEACDCDDPLAMLGGMGEEQDYQVTQMAEAQEEEEAGDIDDPLAMLGGMGEEQVYQVTQMNEANEEEAEEVYKVTLEKENVMEEEEAGDCDDPLAMLGGMGEEQ